MGTHHQGALLERRALSAYINLRRCVNVLDARLIRHLNDEGMTETQFAVLEALLHLGELDQSTLCKKLLTSGGNLTVVLDHLEAKKWVRRKGDPADRRKKLVALTPSGRRQIEGVFAGHARRVTELFEPLSADEQERLRSLCRRLGKAAEGGSHS